MPLRIRIADVKNIGELEFAMPGPGVFVLTGENGSGKTTLLACLVRIGDPGSFPKHFRTSLFSKRLDQFTQAQVTYECPNPLDTVSYTYSGFRWEPTPKKNGPLLLGNSGYTEVLYVAADEGRVTPRREDFRTNRIKPATGFISDHANTIFSTQKFTDLKTVNVRKGVGQQAFVLEVSAGNFASEKNFSLGELAVLKLLRKLESASNDALVIIDELEIALHPAAQERLLGVLRQVAQEKNLTVIFSTHSATLIRATKPQHLLFLERDGKTVNCVTNCYPSYALGRIAPFTDTSPDIVLLVEDQHAQHLLQALIQTAAAMIFPGGPTPTIVCQTVGTWDAVVRFFERSRAVLGPVTRAAVVLDADCRDNFLPPPGHPAGVPYVNLNTPADLRAIFQANANAIRFLPSTPEFGLINEVAVAHAQCMNHLSAEFLNNVLHTIPPIQGVGQANTPAARAQAKARVRTLVAEVSLRTNRPEHEVLRVLYRWYVSRLEAQNAGTAANLLAPLVV